MIIVTDQDVGDALEDRITRFGRFGNLPLGTLAEMSTHRAGNPPLAFENRQRLGICSRIGHGRPGGDHVEGIADHVGENQGDRFGGMGLTGQVAPLDLGEMFAHRVDGGDVRSAGQQ